MLSERVVMIFYFPSWFPQDSSSRHSLCSVIYLEPPPSCTHFTQRKIKAPPPQKDTTASFISHVELIWADFCLLIPVFKRYHYNQLTTVELVPMYCFPPNRTKCCCWLSEKWITDSLRISQKVITPLRQPCVSLQLSATE